MIACRYSNTESNLETVKLLLNCPNIDTNKQSNGGWTALMIACGYSNTDSNLETVKLLLNCPNIDINKQSNGGWTALMLSCKYYNNSSSMKTIELLLSNPSIDPNKNFVAHLIHEYKNFEWKIMILLLDNNIIIINKDILNNIKNLDINFTLDQLLNPLLFDLSIYGELINKFDDKNKVKRQIYFYFHKQQYVLPNIEVQRNNIYYKPSNILSLCHEICFRLKLSNKKDVFDSINTKLKFLFDIKDEDDMLEKIKFYLL